MPKKVIQDVIPPEQKKSIRNIPLPDRNTKNFSTTNAKNDPFFKNSESKDSSQKKVTRESSHNEEPSEPRTTIPSMVSRETGVSSKFKKISYIAGVILLLIAGYLIYMFLHVGAVVTVVPKHATTGVNNTFSAKKNPQANQLGFEVITLEDSAGKVVPTTGEKKIEKKSTGTVIIYNNYNTQPQRLVKNTRLTSSDGHLFRIDSSVVVPGQTKKGNDTIPGSVEVTIVADRAGEEFNLPLSDFTIPGFKDDKARYDKFYARSKTPTTGGFVGTIKTASASDLDLALKELSASLKSNLLKKAREQVSKDFVLYEKAAYVNVTLLSDPESNDVKVKAVLNGIVFNREKLTEIISSTVLPQYVSGEKVEADNLDKLVFTPDSLETEPWNTGNMPFTISGTTTVSWVIDTDSLQKDLLGAPKANLDEIYAKYPIERANTSLEPSWKSVLPDEPSKVKIVIDKSSFEKSSKGEN